MIPESFDDRYDPRNDDFYPSPRPLVSVESLEDVRRDEVPGRYMTEGYRNWLASLGRW